MSAITPRITAAIDQFGQRRFPSASGGVPGTAGSPGGTEAASPSWSAGRYGNGSPQRGQTSRAAGLAGAGTWLLQYGHRSGGGVVIRRRYPVWPGRKRRPADIVPSAATSVQQYRGF